MCSKKILIVFFATAFFACRKSNNNQPLSPSEPIKVVGYLYSDNNWNNDLPTDLSLITDLNLAFVNPEQDGSFNVKSDVSTLVSRAHANNVNVYVSLAGAEPPPFILDLLKDNTRSTIVNNLVALTEQFSFDGIDVDLEGDNINEDYADFINELHASLKTKNKLLTAALATWNANTIHDSTLAKFDFINVMSYDATGPWDPSNPGQHSPFEMAQVDASYFINTRDVPASKILIGLPFYGRGFGAGAPETITYREIVSLYPGAESKDEVEVSGGGKIYYNGLNMIRRKVQLARDLNAAGVMIWELNQDAQGSKSLLETINN